jgi:putative OmpL-like beta-barrel porin-2
MQSTRPRAAWLWSLGLLLSLQPARARAESAPPAPPPAAPGAPSDEPKAAPSTAAPPATSPAEPKHAPPPLEVSGFVDFYYEYNFNRPPAYKTDPFGARIRNDIENKLRNFDFKHNELALNLAEVVLQRAPAPVGFKLKFAYGKATDWIHLSEPGGSEVYQHILEAYLTAPLRFWGKKDTLDVGKFVTPNGAEVIETKDNWNYTRSFLFAWAIPYYHTGLRYTHPFSDRSGLALFLTNGWNDTEDNNNSLSYGASYNHKFGSGVMFKQNWTGGPELRDDSKHWRHLFDTVVTYTPSAKMAYKLNIDYAREARPGGDVSWGGVAGYARRAIGRRQAVALRAEWFEDGDGATTGTPQSLKEVTLTYEWKHGGGLLTRVEGRYDWSNRAVFDKHDGTSKQQPTLLVGVVYSF